MTEEHPRVRTDQLVDEIRERVSGRLAIGEYSEQVAEALLSEPGYLRRIQPARDELIAEFSSTVAAVRQALEFRPYGRSTASRIPGVSLARRALRKLTSTDIEQVYAQIDTPLRRLLEAVQLLQQQIDAVETPLVAATVQRHTDLDHALAELRRAEMLLRSAAERTADAGTSEVLMSEVDTE